MPKPKKPFVEDNHDAQHSWIWQLLTGKLPLIRGRGGIRVSHDGDNTYIIDATPGAGGAAGRWQEPYRELDTTLSVAAGTLVYITAGNTLATAGMTDIVTNANVVSCEGIWEARKNVPAAVGGKYNVPVFPYPSATGVVTGTPGNLKGDLDDDSIFWIYWGQVAC